MPGKLNLLLSDRGKKVFENANRQVTLLGLWEKGLPAADRFMGLPARAVLHLLEEYEIDGCGLVAEKDEEGVFAEISAFRGPTTGHELYFTPSPEGDLILSDLFGVVMGTLPMPQRRVSPEGFLDFLLFQHSPLPESPIRAIRRLEHGDLLHWERGGAAKVSPFRRLQVLSPPRGFLDGSGRVEKALSDILRNMPDGVVNLLSGGIDSTLVQALLGPGHEAVTASIDSPEFAFEKAYAARAASLCGVSRQETVLSETRFLDLIERETAMAGLPLPLPQVPVIATALDCRTAHFTAGFAADSLFSLPRSRRKLVREGAAPESFPVESFSVSSERKLLEALFGKETVVERIRRRGEYVRSRVDEAASLSGLNLGCLSSFFCSSFSVYRQLTASRGKTLDNPYVGRKLVEEALAFPVPERFFRDGVFKPVLKEILSRHLPAYPLEIEKGGSGLPRTRFCQRGPLQGYFRENPLPVFIPEDKADPILEPGWESSMTAFRCIAWSVWEKTVAKTTREENRWGSESS